MRDQRSRLTINWIGGGRMRSLKNVFFRKMGVPSIREGFIRHTDAHARVRSQTRSYRKLFFSGQLLYTSAVAMVTQVCDPAEARDWVERSEGEEGRGTLLEGAQRGTGRGPDTKIIRSMHNNPYKCHFI